MATSRRGLTTGLQPRRTRVERILKWADKRWPGQCKVSVEIHCCREVDSSSGTRHQRDRDQLTTHIAQIILG